MEVKKEWVDNDYYEVLGIAQDATEKEVTSAYRKLAKQYHPDANPDNPEAEAKFKEIASAFEVLGNKEKRASYDQVREMVKNGGFSGQGGFGGQGGFDGAGFGGQGGGSFFEGGFTSGGQSFNIEDIFSNLFGGGFTTSSGASGPVQRVGDDLETSIQLTFDESLEGGSKEVKFKAETDCDQCHGNGTANGEKPPVCSTCNGAGTVHQSKGFFAFEQTCPTCRGAGFEIKDACKKCRGQGRVVEERSEVIPIPKGIDNGQRIRLRGRGGAGYLGGPAGDLFVLIRVSPHKIFHREDLNLYLNVPVTYAEAALGSQVEIPTPYGSAKIKVPSGTATGHQLRVKGKGVSTDRHTGDLYVVFEVVIPKKLNKSQKQLLETLETELNEQPRETFAEYF